MLTPTIKTALAILNDISCGEASSRSTHYAHCPHTFSEVLVRLEKYGLIRPLIGKVRGTIQSYELARPTYEITLLNILEATGSHLNCNREVCEEVYLHYGVAARKLGVINRVTRQCLSEIKLVDL